MTRPDDAPGPAPGGPVPAGPVADPASPPPDPPEPGAAAAAPGRPGAAWWRRAGASSWLVPLLALAAGLVAGFLVRPTAPDWLAPYLPVAVVAALDALAGGLRAALERVFDDLVFVVSFLTNAGVAVALVAVGERLGVGGALTTGVVVVFGIRIFTNATALRRHLFRV
ncbi:small basic family protein [Frankia sp. AgB1.9]|uniref:small basic family protein n=1 Tax=unclassified Frankia TaxID=2632575 RepID=UPI0035A91F05|nr:small basic family protein [Frankia sp. AgB1.9]